MFWWYPLTPSSVIIYKNKESTPIYEYFYAYSTNDDFLVLVYEHEIRIIAFDVIEYVNLQRVYYL